MTFQHSKVVAVCLALAIFGVSGVPLEAQAPQSRGAAIKPPWEHADKSLPKIPLPRFEGERYQAEVPDTLDLSERADLAIHGITKMLDPETDYLMFDHAWFNRKPPVMTISWPEEILSCGNKHLESLPLLRLMSGSTFNIEVDQQFMQSQLGMTATDGCMYLPIAKHNLNTRFGPVFSEPYASVEGEGRNILALAMWYQHDKNPLWKTLIEKKIKRLAQIAIEEDDYAYLANRSYEDPVYGAGSEVYFTQKHTGPAQDASIRKFRFESLYSVHHTNFLLSRSLSVVYRVTGHEPALDLAGKIVRDVLIEPRKGFDDDGRWRVFHFHTMTASLLALLEYAMITQDAELMELVRKGYEYGKVVGDSVLGFFPEYVPGSEQYLKRSVNTSETCEVADMLGLALKLTQAGVGEYWEDADRWVRNQFVENQLTSVDWAKDLKPESFDQHWSELQEKPVQAWETTEVERAIGSFAGYALPNDWGPGSMHMCCSGNAGRTLYWIWDSILTRRDGKVKVNLLLNRASPWLDVDSYLPYEGKVALKIKEAREVAPRIPEWTDRNQVRCQVNGEKKETVWSGNYVEFEGLKKGDTVTVQFPVREKTVFRVIENTPYRLILKGNTVVDIDPKGKINPIYQRDHYRKDRAPTKEVTRFVSGKSLIW